MDPITAGFLIAAGLFSVVLGALCYTPADFTYLAVDGDRVEVRS